MIVIDQRQTVRRVLAAACMVGAIAATGFSQEWETIDRFPLCSNGEGHIFDADREYANNRYTSTIYRSTDHGESWEERGTIGVKIGGFLANPAGEALYIGGNAPRGGENKLYSSADNGSQWNEISSTPGESRYPNIDYRGYLFVDFYNSAGGGDGLHLSKDQGDTWQKLPLERNFGSALCVAPDGKIYAGGDGHAGVNQGYGVWASSDDGQTWTALPSSEMLQTLAFLNADMQANRQGAIFIPINEKIVTTDDNGNTWNDYEIDGNMIGSLIIAPDNALYASTSEGVYKSTDNGENWTIFGSGIPDREDVKVGLHLAADNYLYAKVEERYPSTEKWVYRCNLSEASVTVNNGLFKKSSCSYEFRHTSSALLLKTPSSKPHTVALFRGDGKQAGVWKLAGREGYELPTESIAPGMYVARITSANNDLRMKTFVRSR